MTEKEKMERQLLYDANYDKELETERIRCKSLCQKYNSLPVERLDERQSVIKTILGETGANVHIEPDFWCDYGYRIKVGENFYANHGLVILDAGGVTFGHDVFIGPSCGFHTSGHPIDFERRNQGLEYAYPIIVGDNVWIGAGVQVMPGVTIGSNVVIGSGSIVTKDIPANCVAVGNPCRVMRQITDEDKKKNWDRVIFKLHVDFGYREDSPIPSKKIGRRNFSTVVLAIPGMKGDLFPDQRPETIEFLSYIEDEEGRPCGIRFKVREYSELIERALEETGIAQEMGIKQTPAMEVELFPDQPKCYESSSFENGVTTHIYRKFKLERIE